MIVCARREVKPFTEREISLLESFATQAVLAIENARLFNEVQAKTHDLEEALRYQTGSANILNVIASSPTDVQPVLKAIVESACELCEAYDAVALLREGERSVVQRASRPDPHELFEMADQPQMDRRPRLRRPEGGACPRSARRAGMNFPMAWNSPNRMGHRSIVSVPLLREGESIGASDPAPHRGTSVQRQADRVAANLRRPGRDRARQCPPVRGSAGPHPRLAGVAAAADRDRRRAQGHQPLGVRPADGAGYAGRIARRVCARRICL